MVFSSITFLYYFLPVVLFLYFIVPSKYKNFVLLIASLAFYFYGENRHIIILIISCLVNYFAALLIDNNKYKVHKRFILILAIVVNLGMLCYFKYFNFFIDNINNLFKSNLDTLNVIMPIGISFFTFQTLSYVIDVYNRKVDANKNFINFACYVSLFPQLIAGPIVRYSDIHKELNERTHSFELFGEGVERFIIGLSKKVLIANVVGEMINALNSLKSPSIVTYILLMLGYTLQIYFDFSGYSDMAIGLGKMFGFNFLENFNYPFISKSISEFWKRWHISLSTFFKDYVYIPLGGNRVGIAKHIRNVFVIWFLTGFWHGAGWNFIIWGLYFGVLLISEKYFLKNFLDKHHVIGHIYTIILIGISFVIFSTDNIGETFEFLKNMFGFSRISFINYETLYYLKSYLIILIVAVICSTPILKILYDKLKAKTNKTFIFDTFEVLALFSLLVLSTAFILDSSFNPFLYFRF